MRIGHTLFGGAVAGLVIASGIALCMSNATAKYKVTSHFESSTEASATSTGYGIKKLLSDVQTVKCTATAQGSCAVWYTPIPVENTATATANGRSKAEYSTFSIATADALTVANAVRIVKLYPYQARAFSYAQGEGHAYQLGYAKTGYATANGFGTTYYVGSSSAVAEATITCQPSLKKGVYSDSVAIAEAVVAGQYFIGGAGLATAVADACVDSAVTVNDIRIFTANGNGECVVNAIVQTTEVYQSQTGYCYATIGAIPKIQIGGKGTGTAIAYGEGDSIGMATGAATKEGSTSAFAYGNPKINTNAYSQCTASAISIGNGKLIQTRFEPKIGEATAIVTGNGVRNKLANGAAYSKCSVTAVTTKIKSVRSVDTSAIATAKVNTIVIGIVPMTAAAVSTLKEKGEKIGNAYSSSVAEATAMGYMQVNDLQEAPEDRTYKLEQSVRLTIVSEEPRLVVV